MTSKQLKLIAAALAVLLLLWGGSALLSRGSDTITGSLAVPALVEADVDTITLVKATDSIVLVKQAPPPAPAAWTVNGHRAAPDQVRDLFQALQDTVRPELVGLAPHRITALGIARTFQNQRLFDHMTVLENVLVGMHCRTRSGIASILLGLPWSRKEHRRAKARAAELLGLFGDRLLPRAARPAWTLSYANRRRLEIARGLAAEPRLLLLDAPAAGMNPTETQELMRDIRRIREAGVTRLLIDHDIGVRR